MSRQLSRTVRTRLKPPAASASRKSIAKLFCTMSLSPPPLTDRGVGQFRMVQSRRGPVAFRQQGQRAGSDRRLQLLDQIRPLPREIIPFRLAAEMAVGGGAGVDRL